MHSSFERGLFALSAIVLAFLGGFAVRWHGWFPNDQLEQASKQATGLFESWSSGPAELDDQVYDRSGALTVRPDSMQPGLTLLTSAWPSEDGWEPGLNLIDADGTIVHRWRFDKTTLFPDSSDGRGNPTLAGLHGTYLFPNGDVLVNVEYVGTARIDACGTVQWRLPTGSHHAIARAEDGSFWVPGTNQSPRRATEQHPEGFPGIEDPTWLDQLLHVAEDGTVIEKINVLDVLYANDLEQHIFKAFKPHRAPGVDKNIGVDVTHLNDVEPLSSASASEYPLFDAGDLLVSLRYLDLVFVLDPQSRTVKWHTTTGLIQQHDPDFLGDGWIGIFNNNRDYSARGSALGGSQVVAVQPHTDSTDIRFPTPHSAPFYTDAQGKWQQLENGNMLLTEARAGRVVEVGPDGRTVWEWVQESYDDSQVPVISKGTRYSLTDADVADWPCSPNRSKK